MTCESPSSRLSRSSGIACSCLRCSASSTLVFTILNAAVSACEAVICSIERGLLDCEMREHITKLREQMALLEQGRPIDV